MKSNIFTYNSAKVLYIVDYQTFDAVIDLGFRVNVRERFHIKDAPQVDYKNYGEIKRILSKLVHGKNVSLITHKAPFYGTYLAEVLIDDVNINEVYKKEVENLLKTKK